MIRPAARLVRRALQRFLEHSGPDRAAAVAYYALLSLLPFLIFVISVGVAVMGSFDRAYQGTLTLFQGVVVHTDAATLENLRAFTERATRLQWPGILVLAWTSRRIFGSLFSALETVFGVPARGFAHGNLMALLMVFVMGVSLLLTMALVTVLATVEGLALRLTGALGARAFGGIATLFLTHVLPVLVTLGFFSLLYRLGPGRIVSWRHALAGALLATLLWELAKAGFAVYVRNLARYAGLYGALEGVIVLALWLELSVSIILYCGEVVALLLPESRALALTPAGAGE